MLSGEVFAGGGEHEKMDPAKEIAGGESDDDGAGADWRLPTPTAVRA